MSSSANPASSAFGPTATCEPTGHRARSGELAVAMLELAPRAAGTGVVAPRIAPGRPVAFHETGDGVGKRLVGVGLGAGRGLHLGALLLELAHEPRLFRLVHGADLRELLRHIGAQAVEHPLEELEGLGLV